MVNKLVKSGAEGKGSHETVELNNNAHLVDINDNQILAAIMASLQDAEDAIIKPEQSELYI